MIENDVSAVICDDKSLRCIHVATFTDHKTAAKSIAVVLRIRETREMRWACGNFCLPYSITIDYLLLMCAQRIKIYKNQIENIEKGQRHASFIKCTSTHLQSTQTKREDFVSFRLLSFQFDRFMREGDYACSQNVFIFMLRYWRLRCAHYRSWWATKFSKHPETRRT